MFDPETVSILQGLEGTETEDRQLKNRPDRISKKDDLTG